MIDFSCMRVLPKGQTNIWTLVIIELLLRQNNLLKHFKLIFLRTSTLMVTQKHITHHNSSHRGLEQEGGLMN